MELDTAFVREQFPGLTDDFVLADNAGGSVPVIDVIEALDAFMRGHMVQLGASYPRSIAAGQAVEAGRAALASLIGAPAEEVVVGPSTTVNVQALARALAPTLEPGDEVVVTDLDHEANIGPWRWLEARGVVVKTWRHDPSTAALELSGLEPLLGDRTRIVAFTQVSNVVGRIHDVPAITARVRAAGALSVVDGVAFAPHRRVDVEALGADVYTFSLYKVYGPHQGVLWARRGVFERARSQTHWFHGEDRTHGKLEPGNVNFELTASLVGIAGYLARLGVHHGADPEHAIDRAFELIAAHEAALAERLLAYLRERADITIIGPSTSDPGLRVPTIAFTVEGRNAADIVAVTDSAGVAIRFGDFYARSAIEAMGLLDRGGVVRVSLVHYNTLDEIDRVIAALERTR